jgi:hypothetical protein
VFGGLGQAGQRETIQGGEAQDLWTPVKQTRTLVVCVIWIWGCLLAVAHIIGPLLAYSASLFVLLIRWRIAGRTKWGWTLAGWLAVNVLLHALVPWWCDLIWSPYVMSWSPWVKLVWMSFWLLLASPAALLGYVIAVRMLDPNYPSPRKAVAQREPQMPWYRDRPQIQDVSTEPRLVQVKVESDDPRYHNGLLDLPPVPEWYRFALYILRHPDEFSERTAKRFGVKVDLKSTKPPWYGRGFRQVRDDLFSRRWARWNDTHNHNLGILLYAPALTAFRGYCEAGPPPP